MTKSALAKAAGVSRWTFLRWMQDPLIKKKLAPLNLSKRQQLLPPSAVQIITEHYVIDIA